ncbi:hypothetical protein BLOT_001658 [Blomia tropicalis]|nr:hypothetical protein BLOT_001658 [Blomia tropicalis]
MKDLVILSCCHSQAGIQDSSSIDSETVILISAKDMIGWIYAGNQESQVFGTYQSKPGKRIAIEPKHRLAKIVHKYVTKSG